MTSVVVFGAGYLGTRIAAHLEGATLVTTDITDRSAVRAVLESARPAAVVNAAGKSGHPNVDWCERNRTATHAANVVGPLILAEECERGGVHMVHLGSGCVFYGPSPTPGGWREDDHANPSATYTRSKYAADLALLEQRHVAIARLRMPIDGRPHPRNLITKLAGFAQVVDVENSVTVVDDLVQVVAALIAHRAAGVFHVVNPGAMRHRELLALYRELVDAAHTTTFIEEGELVRLGLATRARSTCVLASRRLAELGIAMRPIEEALRDVMVRYGRAWRGER